MRRGADLPRVARAVLTAVAVAVAGCGGDEGPAGMQLEFQSQALFEDASLVAIYFYDGASTCEGIRATLPRPPSILGPYRADLDEPGREAGIVFRVDAVPAGTYLVFVDALDVNGGRVGTGCSPNQRVLEQDVSSVKVTIRDE